MEEGGTAAEPRHRQTVSEREREREREGCSCFCFDSALFCNSPLRLDSCRRRWPVCSGKPLSLPLLLSLHPPPTEPLGPLGCLSPSIVCGVSRKNVGAENQTGALNIDPSAGANAGTSAHMACVVTNPLTELVWSPKKGLSLKRADRSFLDRKPALLWCAGPSNTPEMKHLIEPSNDQSVMVLENTDYAKTGFIPTHELSVKEKTGNSGNIQEMKTKAPAEIPLSHKSYDEQEQGDGQKGSTPRLADWKILKTPRRKGNSLPTLPGCEGGVAVDTPITRLPSDPSSIRELGCKMVPASEIHSADEHKLSHIRVQSPCKEKGKRKMKMKMKMKMSSSSLPHLDKLESSAENDVQASKIGNVCEEGSRITLKTDSAPAVKTDLMLGCDVNPGDNIISNSQSPSRSRRVHKHESTGKGNALSEGGVSGRFSKDEEEDDSYESVESCNSARNFSAGKRPWNFEQEVVVESKRAKQIQPILGNSSSLRKHDSSFMNWISNMMKGFARPVDQNEETRPLGLALSNTNRVHENLDSLMDGDIRPLNSRNMGFKSIFQSMYCPNNCDGGMITPLHQLKDGSADIELPNQVSPAEANILISLDNENDIKVPKENFKVVLLGNEVVPLDTPKVSVGNLIISQDIVRACSSGNRNLNDFGDGKGKDATKISELPLNGHNAKGDLGYKGDPLGSLWITRFTARSSCSLIKQEVGSSSIGRACESAQNSLDLCGDQAAPEAGECTHQEPSKANGDEEPKTFGFSTEASVVFRRVEDRTLMHKANLILPSPILKSSEEMASVFARKFDALKNIIPSSGLMDDSSKASATCLFCGKKGHHLQNCSEITESELKDLLSNIQSYDKAEVSPCLCIRCFQLNHWAVMCPNTSQKKNLKDMPKYNHKLKEVFTRGGVLSSINQFVNKSNENMIAPPGRSEMWLVSEVPKGVFGAIQALRLSRTDILKWMNSRISLAHLDGFFLRLRLGKWEEGLGGTGYYVACITGMQTKDFEGSPKSPISVNVGGIKCLVESQYVSNHDFLEDELIAWWCTASRGGGKIPSVEDLKVKAEKKRILGF